MAERERVRDLVVVLPGIMGSALAKDGIDVWSLSRQAAWQALKTRLGSLHQLALPADIRWLVDELIVTATTARRSGPNGD